MILSQSSLEIFNIVMYIWFAAGAAIITVFSAKELFFMLTGKDNAK